MAAPVKDNSIKICKYILESLVGDVFTKVSIAIKKINIKIMCVVIICSDMLFFLSDSQFLIFPTAVKLFEVGNPNLTLEIAYFNKDFGALGW